jgi:hypothetical protein
MAFTLYDALNRGNPTSLPEALRLCGLGDMFTPQEWDSGTITASATVTPPGGCLAVQSVHVVTSGTGASVGHYIAGNSTTTPLLPPGGANTAVGICAVSVDGTTITLPNTVTRVIVRYVKKPAALLTSFFNA